MQLSKSYVEFFLGEEERERENFFSFSEKYLKNINLRYAHMYVHRVAKFYKYSNIYSLSLFVSLADKIIFQSLWGKMLKRE